MSSGGRISFAFKRRGLAVEYQHPRGEAGFIQIKWTKGNGPRNANFHGRGILMTKITAIRLAALATTSQLALGFPLLSGASAQEVDALPPVEQAETESAMKLNTITVSARKREESLQDAPLSISALDSEAITDMGVKDISELSNFTPGFTMEKFGGRRGAEGDTSRPVIRGQANILGETNAAVFVDGIPFSGSFLSYPLASVERVEVVKGPQAALFGRSTFAGAVNVITKRGTNDYEHNVTARLAQDDEYEVNLSSSGPLVEDKLFYFLNARKYEYGGEYTNTLTGQTIGDESSWGLNGSLEFHPSENVTMLLSGGYNEDDDGIPAQIAQSRFYNNCFLDQARQYYCGEVVEFDEVTLNTDGLGSEVGLDRQISRVVGKVEWDIGGSGYVLTSNSGLTKSESVFGHDGTYLGDPISLYGGIFTRVETTDQEEWSSELRLDTPVEKSLRGTVGLFYYDREKEAERRRPESTATLTDYGNAYTENWAIFGAAEYDLTDRLTARAEVRYQEDTIGVDYTTGTMYETTFDSVTPRFTLNYDASEDVMVYGVIAKGNKPGYINTASSLPENIRYADEEESWNYEIGAKTTLMDGRVKLNGAVYYIDWTNQQLSDSVFVNGVPQSVVTNAGETEVKGVEIDTQWLATDHLVFSLGYAYADAEITDFCDPTQGAELTGFDCVNSDGIQGGQVAGNQIPNAPKHHLVVSSEFTYPLLRGGEWFVRPDYSFTSKKYAQVHNLAHTGDRSLFNLKTGVRLDSGVTFTMFLDNVFDDRTPSTLVRYADLGNLNTGPNGNPALDNVPGTTSTERAFLMPLAKSRQFGIQLSYDF